MAHLMSHDRQQLAAIQTTAARVRLSNPAYSGDQQQWTRDETLFQEATTRGDYERATVVAGVLIAHAPGASWEYIWPPLTRDDAFGRALLFAALTPEKAWHREPFSPHWFLKVKRDV